MSEKIKTLKPGSTPLHFTNPCDLALPQQGACETPEWVTTGRGIALLEKHREDATSEVRKKGGRILLEKLKY